MTNLTSSLDEKARREATKAQVFAATTWLPLAELAEVQVEAWKQRRQIFSLERDGAELFARYQFDNQLQPLPVIAAVLQALESVSPVQDPWVIAAWFHFPNAWFLQDDRNLSPLEALRQGRADEVARAASMRGCSYVA